MYVFSALFDLIVVPPVPVMTGGDAVSPALRVLTSVGLLVCVTFLEAGVLALLPLAKKGFDAALTASCSVNVVSALIGVCLLFLGVIGREPINTISFAIMFAATLFIEGFLFATVHRGLTGTASKAVACTVCVNVASYAAIGGLIIAGLIR